MSARWIKGDGGDVIVVDDTYVPVLVATWFDAASEGAVRGYFAWLHEMLGRAVKEKVPLVNVTDSTQAGMPSATARRLIAELTKAWEAAGANPSRVTSFVVVDKPIIRGVLQVLAWLHGDLKNTQVATCEQALTGALEVLARAGCKAPQGLVPRSWKRPERSPS